MFDKYCIDRRGNDAQNITVKEKRAATDDSVRLMMEMEKKAFENLMARFKVDDNIVKGTVFLFREDFELGCYKVVSKFKINGEEFTIKNEITTSGFEEADARNILYKNISKEIFIKLISNSKMVNWLN